MSGVSSDCPPSVLVSRMAVIQAQSLGEQGVLHLPVCQTGESKRFWAFLRIPFVTLMNGVFQTLSGSILSRSQD
jgi:hypothetical protein